MTRFLFLPLCGVLLLNGCASKTPAPTAAESQPPAANPPAPSYDSETLSDLLVAEVAAQRQSLGVTLAYYSQAARSTGDPQVISQAAQLAHYLEDHQQALALSELWLEQAPADEEALQLAEPWNAPYTGEDAAVGDFIAKDEIFESFFTNLTDLLLMIGY